MEDARKLVNFVVSGTARSLNIPALELALQQQHQSSLLKHFESAPEAFFRQFFALIKLVEPLEKSERENIFRSWLVVLWYLPEISGEQTKKARNVLLRKMNMPPEK